MLISLCQQIRFEKKRICCKRMEKPIRSPLWNFENLVMFRNQAQRFWIHESCASCLGYRRLTSTVCGNFGRFWLWAWRWTPCRHDIWIIQELKHPALEWLIVACLQSPEIQWKVNPNLTSIFLNPILPAGGIIGPLIEITYCRKFFEFFKKSNYSGCFWA